jgi:hypothetical protein
VDDGRAPQDGGVAKGELEAVDDSECSRRMMVAGVELV